MVYVIQHDLFGGVGFFTYHLSLFLHTNIATPPTGWLFLKNTSQLVCIQLVINAFILEFVVTLLLEVSYT